MKKGRKKGTHNRVKMTISLSPETTELVKNVGNELKMSKSAFIEFMVTQVGRAEKLTIGEYVGQVIKDIDENRKNEVLQEMEKIRQEGL
jgi:hypothetical protein